MHAGRLHMLVMKGLRRTFDMDNAGQLLEAVDYNFGISAQGTVFDPGYWYITTQEAQLGGWVMDKAGIDVMDNIFFGLMKRRCLSENTRDVVLLIFLKRLCPRLYFTSEYICQELLSFFVLTEPVQF